MFWPAILLARQDAVDGRYEGILHIPSIEQPLIVDIDHGSADHSLRGSLILPGKNIKGASLTEVSEQGSKITFKISELGGASFDVVIEDSKMKGSMTQAGNTANLELTRSGPAQVETLAPPQQLPLEDRILGTWVGDFSLMTPRHATLTLKKEGDKGIVELVVVGKRTTKVPMDQQFDRNGFVIFKSSPTGISVEGNFLKSKDWLVGRFIYGPFDVPLVLTRSKEVH